MPNWCHNLLTVSGGEPDVAAFADKVVMHGRDGEGQPLTFAAHVPEPYDPDSYDWYGWRVENWGTKWDAAFAGGRMALGAETMDVGASVESTGVQRADGIAIYNFDTAWGPPLAWLEAASGLEPQLEFELRFGEVGNDIGGRVKFVCGLVVEDEEGSAADYLAPEQMWF